MNVNIAEKRVKNSISITASMPILRTFRTARSAHGKCEKTFCRDGYHISIGNDFHHVENEAIILEYDEVNVFTSNHFGRTKNCRISEDG